MSEVGDRETLTLDDQRKRIEQWCSHEGHDLVEVLDEEDVSGGRPLERRTGLRPAVEAIEDGRADVIVVAYFDRLVRSLAVQAEVLDRVEAAGGRVVALDVGEVSAATSAQWLSSTFLGAVAEYHRRATAERTEDAKRRSIARGEPPFPNIPPGYRKRDDGRIEPSEQAPVISEAFRMRAGGATVREVREFLRESGVERSYHGTQSLLSSRAYLGELHFGRFEPNLSAWEPIIDADTWASCQRAKVPRGRRPKSERLLARLGVLRCATCGARMVVGSAHHGRYPLYRRPPVGDCPKRVTISATVAEGLLVSAVRQLLDGLRGEASSEPAVADAERALDEAEGRLANAIRLLEGLEDEAAARERLLELRAARDSARERLADVRAAATATTMLSVAHDWDALTLDERRALVRAVIDRAEVLPSDQARGGSRLRIHAR